MNPNSRMFAWLKSAALLIVALVLLAPGANLAPARGSQSDQRSNLIQSSRQTIIDSGFTESYFEQHFKLVDAFDKPGDQRVVWRFSLNEYETQLTDAIGYYTGAGGRRIYVHSILAGLGATRDIRRTISKRRARQLMTSCVGKFESESVIMLRLNTDPKTSLYLMAYAARPSKRKEDRDEKTGSPQRANEPDRPPIEHESDNRPIPIGYINLETGKCSRAQASVTP